MNSRFLTLGIVTVVAAACKPPPELTDDTTGEGLSLSEAIPLFFRDFDDDPDKLPEYIDALEKGIEDQGVNLDEPDLQKRSFTIDPIPADFLGGAAQPPGTNTEDQGPVVLFGRSTHPFAANLSTALEPNQVCIESNSTVSYTRTYATDASAFEAGTTDVARSTVELRKELSIIASGWLDLFKDFRSFDTTDGRHVLLARSWSDKIAEADGNNNKEFRQSFTAELYIEDGDKTKRMYAIWSEIDIGLPDDFMLKTVRDSLQEGFDNADLFMTDSTVPDCANDRSAVFTRE